MTRLTARAGASTTSGSATTAAAFLVPAGGALVALVALVALAASSGWTSRRSPSASARRRMRSAWASSIDAEGLEAPMPSFWASVQQLFAREPEFLGELVHSDFLLEPKRSLTSSYPHFGGHSYLFFHKLKRLRPAPDARRAARSDSATLAL